MIKQYPAEIVCEGRFTEIVVVREELDPLPEDIENQVNAIWNDIKKVDPGIPDTQLFSSKRIDVDGNKITLVCGPSSRRYLKGTTHQSLSHIDPRYIRRGVSGLAITLTKDNFLVLGMREVGTTYPICRHGAPAGRLEVREGNPFNGIYTEYEQELGIRREEIAMLDCIGYNRDLCYGSQSDEFVFLGRLALTAAAVAKRYHTVVAKKEYQELEFFPWNPDFVRDVVCCQPRNFPPTGYAAVAMACRHDFGQELFPIDWEPTPEPYESHMAFQIGMIAKAIGK